MPARSVGVVYHPRRISRRAGFGLASAIAVIGLVVDQLSKQWAVTSLTPGLRRDVVGDLLGLRLVFNPGAAFSFATGFTPVLTALALVAVTGVVAVIFPRCRMRRWAVVAGLVAAGAGGNVIDRLVRAPGVFHGHVVDFLELPSWPIFNVADICLCCAAGLTLLWSFTRSPGLTGVRRAAA